jgi:choline dehydrogenase-like flavoprotein
MLRSAFELDDDASLECDLCIVGSGAAGLAVAHEFAGSGLRVIVLAGGGWNERRRDQSLYQGTVLDPKHHSWADKYRVRRFGGTTNIWGGRCLPFDDIDFEARPYLPDSGWPFGRAELDPYYLRASNYCESGVPLFDAALALPDQPGPMVPDLDERAIISSTIERFSRPTDFGKLLRRNLAASASLTVLFDAHCVGLSGNERGDAVAAAECATFKPNRFSVRARHYVLAAGGIETTRLVMNAAVAPQHRLAISSPWLGRGYMCHLVGNAGLVRFNLPPSAIQFDYHRSAEGIYCRRRFWVSPEEQRRLGILNVIFRLTHAPISNPVHGDPVLSAMYLVKDLILYEYSRKMRDERSWRRFIGHVRNVASHPVRLARFAVRWVRYRNLSPRQLPSVVLFSDSGSYELEFQSEQAPDPASRIELSDKRDAFGMRQVIVDWRCSALDVESVRQAYLVLQRALQWRGIGTLELDEAQLEDQIRSEGVISAHQLGSLRIGSSPAGGVVDSDAKLFGVANCHIASGAIMPTSGAANPTFTIAALAIRLADRLKSRLATPPTVGDRRVTVSEAAD